MTRVQRCIKKAKKMCARKDYQGALEQLEKLVAEDPQSVEFWVTLGNTLSFLQQLHKAAESYQRALVLESDNFSALYQLGCTMQEMREFSQAIDPLQKAVALNPSHAMALCVLGLCQFESSMHEEGCGSILSALKLEPKNPRILARMAFCLEDISRPLEALVYMDKAIAVAGEFPSYIAAKARILLSLGRITDADQMLERVLSDAPDNPELLVAKGLVRIAAGKEDGVSFYERVLVKSPDADDVWGLKGLAYETLGRPALAVECLNKALSIAPDCAVHHHNISSPLLKIGRLSQALEHAKRAVELAPHNRVAFDNFLFYLHYLFGPTRDDVFSLHRQWAQHYFSATEKTSVMRSGHSPLRVGFVSGDLCAHAVAFFLIPLLRNLSEHNWSAYAYSNSPAPDRVSDEIRSYCTGWNDICGLDDARVCELVRQDEVDLLVDLSGHTKGNRLGVFAAKPAPFQASWLGYPDTTGLEEIDWRIVDNFAEPDSADQSYSSEELLRIDGGFHCYVPPNNTPALADVPLAKNGYVTFGSFNNYSKVSDQCVALWAHVLSRVPGSKLYLKSQGLGEPTAIKLALERFEKVGVEPSRIMLKGMTKDVYSHLQEYNQVDIALDAFPYNGTTTTCESLWMGVPVISLRGDRHCSRMGWSLLNSAGLAEFCYDDPEAFVAGAVELAQDTFRLRQLRQKMREELLASPLMDAQGFARKFCLAVEQRIQR